MFELNGHLENCMPTRLISINKTDWYHATFNRKRVLQIYFWNFYGYFKSHIDGEGDQCDQWQTFYSVYNEYSIKIDKLWW